MYKIIGSDQRIYGPVGIDQIRLWLAEGRVTPATLAQPEAGGEWKPLGAWPEFAAPPPVMLPPRPQAQPGGSGMAVAGLTLGLLSMFCCGFGLLFAALGVIFSSVALAHSNSGARQSERGMAIAGLVVSIVSLLWHSFVPAMIGLFSPWGLLRRHRLGRLF